MRHAIGHDDIATKLPRVAPRNEDAAIMRDTASEGSFIDFHRGSVVITVLILALERIEAAEKMNRPGRNVGTQFDRLRDGSIGSGVHRSPAICPAATGKNKCEQDYESSCYNAMRFRHEAQ